MRERPRRAQRYQAAAIGQRLLEPNPKPTHLIQPGALQKFPPASGIEARMTDTRRPEVEDVRKRPDRPGSQEAAATAAPLALPPSCHRAAPGGPDGLRVCQLLERGRRAGAADQRGLHRRGPAATPRRWWRAPQADAAGAAPPDGAAAADHAGAAGDRPEPDSDAHYADPAGCESGSAHERSGGSERPWGGPRAGRPRIRPRPQRPRRDARDRG